MQQSPARNGAFARVWLSHSAAQFGDQIGFIALPLTASLMLAASPSQLGWINAAYSAPFVAFALFAGALADRLSRRAAMIAAEVLRLIMTAALASAALAGWLTIPAMAVCVFVAMSATVLFDISQQSYVPQLVGRDGLGAANTRLELTRSLAVIAGPALVGLVTQPLTPAGAVLIASTAYLCSLASLASISRSEVDIAPRPVGSMLRDITDGLRFVTRHRLIWPLTLCGLFWNFAWFAQVTALVPFLTNELAVSPRMIGAIFAMQGIGALLGALIAVRVQSHITLGRAIMVGPILSAVAGLLPVFASGDAWGIALLMASQFLIGLGPTIWAVVQLSLRQAITPDHLLGRVGATNRFMSLGMRPLGALAGGFIGEAVSLRFALAVGAAAFIACLIQIAASPIPRLRRTPSHAEAAAMGA
jgi:predicted MFS family arabinose efflux permease